MDYATTLNSPTDFVNAPAKIPFTTNTTIINGYSSGDNQIQLALNKNNKDISIQLNTTKYATNYGVGLHSENGSVLGAKLSGSFKHNGGAMSAYMHINKNIALNDWNLSLNSLQALTNAKGFSGMVQGVSTIHTNTYSLQIATNKFGFGVRQPLRIEQGSMDILYVNSIAKGNKLGYAKTPISLSPSGRQIDIETFYKLNANMTVRAMYSKDDKHIKGNDSTTVYAQYSVKF